MADSVDIGDGDARNVQRSDGQLRGFMRPFRWQHLLGQSARVEQLAETRDRTDLIRVDDDDRVFDARSRGRY